MRSIALAALVIAAGPVHAAATATADIFNRTPAVLTFADGATQVVDGPSVTLTRGQSVSYAFDYALAVSDDGLPFQSDSFGPFWTPSSITVYDGGKNASGIPVNGHEIGFASIYFDSPCNPAGCAPGVTISAPSDMLATFSDGAAQSFSTTGHMVFSVGLDAGSFERSLTVSLLGPRTDVLALGNTAAPLQQAFDGVVSHAPEPGTYALMLAGLGLLALRRRLQVGHAVGNLGE